MWPWNGIAADAGFLRVPLPGLVSWFFFCMQTGKVFAPAAGCCNLKTALAKYPLVI